MRVRQSFDPAVLRIAGEFIWQTFLIGLVLFVMPPFATAPSAEQHGVAFIAVVVWCYYDGSFACGNWPRALLEGGIGCSGEQSGPRRSSFFSALRRGLNQSISSILQHGFDQPRTSLI
jgi:hypothetical protein